MKISVAKRDRLVQVDGPTQDVLSIITLLGRSVERAIVCINGDSASACWGIE